MLVLIMICTFSGNSCSAAPDKRLEKEAREVLWGVGVERRGAEPASMSRLLQGYSAALKSGFYSFLEGV